MVQIPDTTGIAAWRFIDHTADVAVEVEADSLEGVIAGSVAALEELVGRSEAGSVNHSGCPDTLSLPLVVEERLRADHLVELLNEVLYSMTVDKVRFSSCELNDDGGKMNVIFSRVYAGKIAREIKAITYHRAILHFPEVENNRWLFSWIADV